MDAFARDVRRGLTAATKQIEPKYFYDSLGSALFGAICELPEYYVTRAERDILDRHARDIARAFGNVGRLVELGSGNARKTQRIIDAILKGAGEPPQSMQYIPIDVDRTVLEVSRQDITRRFPAITVEPLCGDYDDVATLGATPARTIVMFLGSSIGNLDDSHATRLLRTTRKILQSGDAMFVGFDLKKEKHLLESAYDDALGVTAAFNLNLLVRINRELGGNFRLDQFSHRAFFNDAESRIEMHLVSKTRQTVHIAALQLDVPFEDGETIHTESSHKYDVARIESLAASADFRVDQRWTDAHGWFADVLLRVK